MKSFFLSISVLLAQLFWMGPAVADDSGANTVNITSMSFDLAQLYHRDRYDTLGGRALGSKPEKENTQSGAAAATLRTIITLAWEGRDLRPENLAAIDSLRKKFPKLRFMHFISPAYFLRDHAARAEAATTIKARILPDDDVGLLLNGWKSATSAAKIPFRSYPTFWGSTLREIDCQLDCGLEVPINIYPARELRQLIASGLDTLEAQGFGRPIAIQTSGWVASPQMIESAIAEGMRYDFSAIPLTLIEHRIRLFPLHAWVSNLWLDVTPSTEPYELRVANAQITQVPQSLGVIDYHTRQTATAAVNNWLKIADQRRAYGPPVTATLGLNQETADLMAAMSVDMLESLLSSAKAAKINIESSVLPDTIDAPPTARLAAETAGRQPEKATPALGAEVPEIQEAPVPTPAYKSKEPPKVH